MEKHVFHKKSASEHNKITMKTIAQIESLQIRKTRVKTAKRRSNSSTLWLQRQLNDPFVRCANDMGFLSRAAFKLIEIDEKYKIFKPGMVVMDLGAAPGSWMQVAMMRLKNKATIIGVDILPIKLEDEVHKYDDVKNNVHFVIGDITKLDVQKKLQTVLNERKADVILSDIAPNTTGIKSVDHLALIGILEDIWKFIDLNLKIGGSVVIKVFQGIEFNSFIESLKLQFANFYIFKPKASRKGASEMYLIGMKKK